MNNGLVRRAVDIVKYQPDSIVSRELINQPSGTVTVFAFAAGQRLSEHTAPFTVLVLVLDGEAEINLSGTTHLLKKGETIVIPAGQAHGAKALKEFKMLLVMLKTS